MKKIHTTYKIPKSKSNHLSPEFISNATKNVKIENNSESVKTELYEEFKYRLTALFNIFQSSYNKENIKLLKFIIQICLKKSFNCDSVLILERTNKWQCEGQFVEQSIIFPDLEKYLMSNSPCVNNKVYKSNEIAKVMYDNMLYAVKNYMVIPIRLKKLLASELIIFIDRKSVE